VNVLKEVLAELWSMFVGDRRLTLAVLAVVATAAATAALLHAPHLAAMVILAGALVALVDSVLQAAGRRQR
jgi:hypothetical protein